MLKDTFGRVHDYLRISLTERCNLRCFYCMPEEGIQLRDKAHFMTSEEIIGIAKVFVKLGVKKIRLTGGEPLIKKDIVNIITKLGELPVELTLTTNAILVDRYIHDFKAAGIKSINVSLDSLDEKTFNAISRRNYFEKIKANIALLIQHGFHVKINVVVIRDVNEHEIPSFIAWTQTKNIHIRFIEFMPFDKNKWEWDKKVAYKEIMQIAEKSFGKNIIQKIEDKKNDTAKCYQLKNGIGTFGIISSVTNPFCDTCNRIRLTADGKLLNCLFAQNESDVLTEYRKNMAIEPIIRNAILNKKKERGGLDAFNSVDFTENNNRAMTAIGG